MRTERKATNTPVRWQPYPEMTTAAAASYGGEGSLHTSLLGGGRGSAIVEQNLLSQFKGDAELQVTDDRPEPSLALSLRVGAEDEQQPPPAPQQQQQLQPQPQPSLAIRLRVGAEEELQPQNRLLYAPTRQSPSLLPAGSSVPVPPQTYAPGSAPAGAGLPPPPQPPQQLGSKSNLQLGVGATPPQPGWGACICRSLAADLLKMVSEDLDRRVGLLRQELGAEVRKDVLRLHAAAVATAGVPRPQSARPTTAFSAAGLLLPQPCGGGAWPWCLACGARPGTVVLKPYEHLCLCAQCSADASRVCPVCSFTWTGPVDTARGRGRRGSLPPRP